MLCWDHSFHISRFSAAAFIDSTLAYSVERACAYVIKIELFIKKRPFSAYYSRIILILSFAYYSKNYSGIIGTGLPVGDGFNSGWGRPCRPPPPPPPCNCVYEISKYLIAVCCIITSSYMLYKALKFKISQTSLFP